MENYEDLNQGANVPGQIKMDARYASYGANKKRIIEIHQDLEYGVTSYMVNECTFSYRGNFYD